MATRRGPPVRTGRAARCACGHRRTTGGSRPGRRGRRGIRRGVVPRRLRGLRIELVHRRGRRERGFEPRELRDAPPPRGRRRTEGATERAAARTQGLPPRPNRQGTRRGRTSAPARPRGGGGAGGGGGGATR